ncbi:MAG TPA: hypothetical protein VFQ61_10865 [Polyangiaceae bacterium]|nr:hypothetical protein [Polyangiaceae bacterium]
MKRSVRLAGLRASKVFASRFFASGTTVQFARSNAATQPDFAKPDSARVARASWWLLTAPVLVASPLMGCSGSIDDTGNLPGSGGFPVNPMGGAAGIGGALSGGDRGGFAGAAPQGGAIGSGGSAAQGGAAAGTLTTGMGGSSTATAGAAGAGACQAGQASCSGSCVDLQSNAQNCGQCGRPCSADQVCSAGQCTCAAPRAVCSGKCVDLQTDAANCGTCGTPCGAGLACAAGLCQCAAGQLRCGAACVDPMKDLQNCGGCGTPCALGQSCTAGQCVESNGGAAGPDGCSGLAQNVTLSQVDVFQSVRVRVMNAGQAVAAAARNTDVVAGREAMFRLFATVGSGWVARNISGRVLVENNGQVDVFYTKKSLAGSSQEGTLDSTIQVKVPKEKITTATRYQVELVECGGAPGGAVQSPKFPATSSTPLEARTTGVVKVRVIPLTSGSNKPDTSEAALQIYRDEVMAIYPVTDVQITVGDSLSVADPKDWTTMLDQVRAKRRQDAPAADIYYYGLLKPTNTLREYCGSGCTAGIGYVVTQGSGSQQAAQRAALGLGFSDNASAETMAHEVGHNHGRSHAPCVQGGTISGVDAAFPQKDGTIGVYGWDLRKSALIPPTYTDMMGYCSKQWISDYTYKGILNRVASLNTTAMASEVVRSELIQPYRVLLIEPKGARWGIPISEPALPSGEPELADLLDATGQTVSQVEVYRTAISDIEAFSVEVPEPPAGVVAIRVAGAAEILF